MTTPRRRPGRPPGPPDPVPTSVPPDPAPAPAPRPPESASPPSGPESQAADPAEPAALADMELSHLRDVLRVERACFPDPWSLEAFRREVARRSAGGYPRVLVEAGAVQAFAISWFVEDEAHLANLAVAPERRRRGYGRILLRDFLDEARRRGAATAWLEVRAGNDPARSLYLEHGFRVVGIRKGYYRKEREDAVIMVRDLFREPA